MAKRDKRVPNSALPKHTDYLRVPIKNTEGAHSFVISMIYLEDEGPVCRWSDSGELFFEAMRSLGGWQRNQTATTESKQNHYHRDKEKLVSKATEWLDGRSAVSSLRDYLWAFRVAGTHRVWGILTDGVFYVLWNDPNHEIYPTSKG